MKKMVAKVLVCMMILMLMAPAMAAEYPSAGFRLPIVKARPTVAPTPAPALEEALNPDRSISISMEADGEMYFGMEATMVATLHGYENAVYTLQWQTSVDGVNWQDIPEGTTERCTVVVTEENYMNYWRVEVTVTDVNEEAGK